jgi:hypothetical protein
MRTPPSIFHRQWLGLPLQVGEETEPDWSQAANLKPAATMKEPYVFAGILWSSGGGIRTRDLRVMSQIAAEVAAASRIRPRRNLIYMKKRTGYGLGPSFVMCTTVCARVEAKPSVTGSRS